MTVRRLTRTHARSDRDLVTILICNHNYERYLAAAIDSALSQTHRPLEVVVVDDGSTDGSREILRRYGPRIRTLLKENGGQASALNLGFHESRGEIVCLLDSDDVFDKLKVARVADAFRCNPNAGWVYHELDYIDHAGRLLPLDALPDLQNVAVIRRRREMYQAYAAIDLRSCFAAGERMPYTCPAFSALSFRRSTLDAILPMPEDIAKASDEFIKIAAVALFPGIHLGHALAWQRLHAANAATFRADARAETAKRYLKTAYHLRRRFAPIGPAMDKWFASCFGRLVGASGTRAAFALQESRLYFADYFGPTTWIRQGPRIAFNAAREAIARRTRAGTV